MAHRISKKCIACGICREICPEDAVRDDEKSEIFTIEEVKCTDCGLCLDPCPVGAISKID